MNDKADPINRCLGCMAEIGLAAKCPHCGWTDGSGPSSPIYLPTGIVLNGKYLIGRVLGHGGFGITYLAWDLNLQVKLAIKEYLPRDLATRSEGHSDISVYEGESEKHFVFGKTKFIEEARSLAQFEEQAGVVSVRDYFEENGTAYFVMHYVEGLTFKSFIQKKGGKIPYATAIKVMAPVMRSLGLVHRAGLLHRDISPDNIYITKTGQVKILDFGAARYSMGEYSRSLSVILKPGYAPEEQYRSKGKQGPWTDVYAAASTLYRAVMGRTPPESLDRLAEDTLAPPSKNGVDIPPEAEAALMKALSVRAASRFQSMPEFLSALMGKPAESPPGHPDKKASPDHDETIDLPPEPSAEPPTHEPTAPGGPKGIPGWVWAAGSLAAVIIIVAAAFLIWPVIQRRHGPPREELLHIPIVGLQEVIQMRAVQFDPHTSIDDNGSLRVEVDGPKKIRLYDIPDLDIRNGTLIYEAHLRTEDLKGRAFLEMFCRIENHGVYFSRGLDSARTGTADWTPVAIPFFVKEDQHLIQAQLNLVVAGRGTVWIDDIRLFSEPLPPEFPDMQPPPRDARPPRPGDRKPPPRDFRPPPKDES